MYKIIILLLLVVAFFTPETGKADNLTWSNAVIYSPLSLLHFGDHPNDPLTTLKSEKTFTDPITGIEFIWIAGGCFSPSYEYDEEHIRRLEHHQVCLDGFWISKYETTNAQYRQYSPNHITGRDASGRNNRDSHPVGSVDWEDAANFATWLSRKTPGAIYKLPTPLQWEFAAVANTNTVYSWGNKKEDICEHVAIADRWAKSTYNCRSYLKLFETAPVGSYQPNPLGLYDMIGNVWEWVDAQYRLNLIFPFDISTPNTSNHRYKMGGGSSNEDSRLWSGAFKYTDPQGGFNYHPPSYDSGFRLIRIK